MDLGQKVEFLSDVRAYEGNATHVEARETHMSWVFITDRLVYKLKKPVKYPFLDFSTLARRRFFCEEEVRLNRRLAPQTYRRTAPLRCDRSGRLALGDARRGRTVDWLVEMERLPEAEMLEARIIDGRLEAGDVQALGTRLADFYSGCAPEFSDGGLYLRHLMEEQAINRSLLTRSAFGLADIAKGPLDAVDRALADLAPAIENRIRGGLVVEGHGDLRPEHVCLAEPLQIIDCLEFSRAMRIIDPYDEVNYLGLECAMLGADWIGPMLVRLLAERIGHAPEPRLSALYRAFRALLRARLCMAHLLEARVSRPEKWKPLAERYIAVAARECVSLRGPADPTAAAVGPGA